MGTLAALTTAASARLLPEANVSDILEKREAIRSLIAKSAKLLDAEDFEGYTSLFIPSAEYAIIAYSPEIGRDSTWFRVDREELARLMKEAPQHIHDLASRFHLVTVDDVDIDGDTARAASNFVVIRTAARGESSLYAVGEYQDELICLEGKWCLSNRTVRVHTRMLQVPTPMPL
jgi:3-phenylpropionate/cinnamic acid dioxygenase small subunit